MENVTEDARLSGGEENIQKRAEFSKYTDMSDAELALASNAGDGTASEYLLNKYKHFVRAKARSYFIVGADKEDLIQEGMIGLYKAIRDYDIKKKVSFSSFAELCITRQVITAIKAATRQKHKPLNTYVSLSKPVYEEESDRTLLDIIISGANVLNPEEIFIDKEDISSIKYKMGKLLSKLEWKVLSFYLSGKSYQEIANLLGKDIKSIDNALQRVKTKLESYLLTE